MTKLTIKIDVEETSALGEYFPGYSFQIEAADAQDWTVHSWFKIFEKVLAAQGFSEYVICKGGVELAFNEWRKEKDMERLYQEYDLGEFHPEPEEDEVLGDVAEKLDKQSPESHDQYPLSDI